MNSSPKKLSEQHIRNLSALISLYGGSMNEAATMLATEAVYQGSLERRADSFQLRADSISASPTPYTRDELTQVLSNVLRKRRTKLRSREIFQSDNELVPGMQSFRMYRVEAYGEPTILGQGGRTNDITDVSLSSEYKDAPIEYYALNAHINYLEDLASTNSIRSLVNSRAEKLRASRENMERYQDRRVWKRVHNSRTFTLLNNTYMPFIVSTQEVGDAMTGKELYEEVCSWIAAPVELKQVETPDAATLLAVTPALGGLLRRKVFDSEPSYTVWKAILDNTSIEEIVEVSDLDTASVPGYQTALVLDPDDLKIKECMKPTPIPGQKIGLGEDNYIIGADGGIIPMNAGAHARVELKLKSKYAPVLAA